MRFRTGWVLPTSAIVAAGAWVASQAGEGAPQEPVSIRADDQPRVTPKRVDDDAPTPPPHATQGTGGTIIATNANTPCFKHPGTPFPWETVSAITEILPNWNPCTGNYQIFLAGGLTFNSELNNAAQPFHRTQNGPPSGPYGWNWNLGQNWYITEVTDPSPGAVVTAGDGTPFFFALVVNGATKIYVDQQGQTWRLYYDGTTWTVRTFDGTQLNFNARPSGILLSSVSDKAGNSTKINFNTDDTIASVRDYLGRTITYTYVAGRLDTVTSPPPESLRLAFTYDNNNNLVKQTLPPAADGTERAIFFKYNAGSHLPLSMTDGPQIWTFDWYFDGALVNAFMPNRDQYHAQYNANARSNLVTLENPTLNTPQLKATYNGTYDLNSNKPWTAYWVKVFTATDGVSVDFDRQNEFFMVTTYTDRQKQKWESRYFPGGFYEKYTQDPAGNITQFVWQPDQTPGVPDYLLQTRTSPDGVTITNFKYYMPTTVDWTYHEPLSVADSMTLTKYDRKIVGSNKVITVSVNGQNTAETVYNSRFTFLLEAHTEAGYIKNEPDAFDQLAKRTVFDISGKPMAPAETFSFSPNGLFQSFTNSLGRTEAIGKRDEMTRALSGSYTVGSSTLSGWTREFDKPGKDVGASIKGTVTAGGKSFVDTATYGCNPGEQQRVTHQGVPLRTSSFPIGCNYLGDTPPVQDGGVADSAPPHEAGICLGPVGGKRCEGTVGVSNNGWCDELGADAIKVYGQPGTAKYNPKIVQAYKDGCGASIPGVCEWGSLFAKDQWDTTNYPNVCLSPRINPCPCAGQ